MALTPVNRKNAIAYVRMATQPDHRLTQMLLWSAMREMNDEELEELMTFSAEWRAHCAQHQAEYFQHQSKMPIE